MNMLCISCFHQFTYYICWLRINNEPVMLKVIIVDDEAKARKSLTMLLEKIGNVQIVDSVENAQDAIRSIATQHPDIVFLDVKMPGMSGFDMLDSIDRIVLREFDVVFLTAYDEFAIRAIKYSAFDYLLKPVDEAELRETIDRYLANVHPLQDYESLKSALNQNNKIKIRTSTGFDFINAMDVVYIEGDGNYSKFVLDQDDERTVSRTLKDISVDLPEEFLRVHKKYFINRQYLISINRQEHECLLGKGNVTFRIPVSVRMMKHFR
ncbi:Transcriptional regulatory protein BtsR [anaerobic digester metagenome]